MSKEKLTRTVRTKVYKFDALSDEAKKKAIEYFRDTNVDYDWWNFVYEDLTMLCETMGIEVDTKQTYFSGFAHQGQGSAFTADIPSIVVTIKAVDEEKWKEHAPNDKINLPKSSKNIQRILKLIDSDAIDWSSNIVTGGRETSVKVEFSSRYQGDYVSDLTNIDNTLEQLAEHIQDIVDELNHWFFKRLEDEYDYLTSDKAVIESIKSNEYEFTKDGNFFSNR
jgi:hypothetical protein